MDSASPLSPETAQGIVRKILSGPTFAAAPRLSRLLEACVAGSALDDEQRGDLKRLARKLEDYYSAEGVSDPVRVSVSQSDGSVRWDIRDASVNSAAWIPPEPVAPAPAKTSWIPYAVGVFLLLTMGAWWYTRTPSIAPGEIKTLAVLPFEDSRTLREHDGMVDGLGASLARVLSHVDGLRVPEYSSSSQYKFRLREMSDLKSKLGADGIVEGSIRVTASDIEGELWMRRTSDGARLWHAPFRAPRGNLLVEIDRHAEEIAKLLGKSLPSRALNGDSRAPADSVVGYLRAIANSQESPKEMEKAYRTLEEVEKAAPKFASAASALAEMWARITVFEYRPIAEAAAKTKESAAKALALSPESAEAHVALGAVAADGNWDWGTARKEFETALRLRPSYAFALNRLAHLDEAEGRPKEALAKMRAAHALDPFRPSMNFDLGYSRVFNREYDEALRLMEAYEKQDPYHNSIRFVRGLAYFGKGNWAAVESHVRPLEKEEGFEPPALSILGVNHARAGRRADAIAVLKRLDELDKLTPIDAVIRAGIQFALGQTDEGFRSLNRAADKRSPLLLTLRVNPLFDGVRGDPRYQALVNRLTLK